MKAVTITGEAVKRLKKDCPPLLRSGKSLGLFALPCTSATIASTELMITKSSARRNEIAELKANLSTETYKNHQNNNKCKVFFF